MSTMEPIHVSTWGDRSVDFTIDSFGKDDKSRTDAATDGGSMRQKLREIRCIDDMGREAFVIEWGFGTSGSSDCTCREFRLEDDSPVNAVGGAYEHFYSGRLFRPA